MRQSLSPVGGFYKDPDLHWSAQDVLNWIPVPAERAGTRTKWQFRDAPGLKPLIRIVRNLGEGGTVDAGPIRGMRSVEDKLFVVAGTQLYQITNSGVAIPYGNVPGVGRVSMAHNQRGNGNQLLIVNGSAGYVFDTSSLVFQKVTDNGYPGAFIADFVDGYLVQVEPQGRYWFHSDLSNALEYNTLDQYEAEADPDRIVTLHVSFREVLVFGKDTIEPYVNSGGATGTFTRASNTVIQCGCSAKFSPKTMDNSVFFLDDKRIVRRLDGYTPVRVSTVAIEAALAECSREEIAAAFAYTFEDRGHKIYYLTVPGRFTFGYDVLSQEWHRRGSPGMGRLRLNDLVFWNGKWIGGDFQRGRLYELDWDYMLDACDELERERVTGVLSADQQMIEVNEVELVLNVGGEESVCAPFPEQPDGPSISGAAPDGVVGVAYAGYSYLASGGTPPYSFVSRPGSDIAATSLPMNSAGTIPATPPTLAGTFVNIPRVTDANGLWAELHDSITIETKPVDWLILVDQALGLLFSPDGANWTGAAVARPGSRSWSVSRWSPDGLLMSDRGANVALSTDGGDNWTTSTLTNPVSGNKINLLRANGYWFIPGGTGRLKRSASGTGVWTEPSADALAIGEQIGSLGAEGSQRLVLLARDRAKASLSDDNGATWAPSTGNVITGESTPSPVLIDSDGERVVIGSQLGVLPALSYSDTGDTFTLANNPFTSGQSVSAIRMYGDTVVAGNDTGQLAVSHNKGVSYVQCPPTGTVRTCRSIDTDGMRWIAVFQDGVNTGYYLYSVDDGDTWTQFVPSTGSASPFEVTAMGKRV